MMTANRTSIRSSAEKGRLTPLKLVQENQTFAGTGGVSSGNQNGSFLPAFLETRSGEIYLSRFADGRPAPVHVLDGLPPALVTRKTPAGRVSATLESVISGFVRAGQFYTREQTAKLIAA
ncbi:MAG: hypothetical protein WAN46_22420 [Gammaproteobacteria bacterium]